MFYLQIGPTKAEKEQYLIEATAFAANVAEEMNEPEAEKLYCPVYRVKPCGCVQRFITGGDGQFFSKCFAIHSHSFVVKIQ
jgi:Zn-finger protein